MKVSKKDEEVLCFFLPLYKSEIIQFDKYFTHGMKKISKSLAMGWDVRQWDGMAWDGMLSGCDDRCGCAMRLVVRSCDAMRCGCVMW